MANPIDAINPTTGQPLQVADMLQVMGWARQYVENWLEDADSSGEKEEIAKARRAEVLVAAAWPMGRAAPLMLEQLKRAAGDTVDSVLQGLDSYAEVLEAAADEASSYYGKLVKVGKFLTPYHPTGQDASQGWWLRIETEAAAMLISSVVGQEKRMYRHDGTILLQLDSVQEARDIGKAIAEHGDPAVPLVLRLARDLTEVPDE